MWKLSPAALGCLAILGASSCTPGVHHPSVSKAPPRSARTSDFEGKASGPAYRYDPRRDDCVNAQGETGFNAGHLGECGAISDLDLTGVDLSGGVFDGLRATRVRWIRANLQQANFQGAWIVESDFSGADLREANFSSTLLENSILKNAQLQGADFRDATWEEMGDGQLQGAVISATTHLPGSIEDYEEHGLLLPVDQVQELRWADGQGQAYRLRLDEGLTPLVRSWVTLDLQKLMGLNIEASEDSAYAKIFGGTGEENVLRYFFSRIAAIVNTDFDDFSLETTPLIDAPGSSTLASNLGTALLLENIYLQSKSGLRKSARIAGQTILPEPGRNGILMLGPAYTRSEADQILRLSTLVHEARHTDCPVPPSAEILTPLLESESRIDGMSGLQCGNFHIPCPEGSELEGILACDNRPDGAYGAASAFALALDRSCENCTERERARARITWLENKNRIYPKLD